MKFRFVLLIFFFFLFTSPINAITLTGDTVTVQLYTDGTLWEPYTVTVESGFEGGYFSNMLQFDLDYGVDGDIFALWNDYVGGGLPPEGATYVEWRLTDLNFDMPLTGVSIVQDFGNAIVASWGSDYVTFRYDNVSMEPTNRIFFQAQFESTPVPEPATMLLLGCGLLVIGTYSRRFKKFES